MAKTKLLEVGDQAPDFILPSSSGSPIQLSALYRHKIVVLYFYPKDSTPGCTAEACHFRDQYSYFINAGAEILGVSADSEDSHDKFIARYGLPFTLVSDIGGQVRKQYGVSLWLGLVCDRVTFVIDRFGIIRHRFRSQLQVNEHVRQALDVVQNLEREFASKNQ